MKTLQKYTVSLLILFTSILNAQTMKTKSIEERLTRIEDKLAIKALVDTFSNLADTKEIDQQVMLFTEDGEVVSVSEGNRTVLKGRAQLKAAFEGFLANFHTVYHQNGQQTIEELTETSAKATSYCRVILVGNQEGTTTKTTLYTIYNDVYEKQNGKWLIKNRTSNFVRREVEVEH